MIKVLLIDDHQSVLDSFTSVISHEEDMKLIGTLTDASFALQACRKFKPHVVLTDVCTDNSSSGIDAAKEIKATYPEIKIIIMSGFDEISYIPNAIAVGANAFLSKTRPIHEFVDMIRKVMEGEGSFPEPVEIPTVKGLPPFSQRELEVLRLLCKAYKREEIAKKLDITPGTIKRHVENMLLKSGCDTTMELAVYVTSNGWITTK